MALHYLIDGYNLLYALKEIPPGTLQQKRETLLAWLQRTRPQGNNRMTVVFDSRNGLGDRFNEGDLEVIFTTGETADDKISAMVREVKNPRTVVVVSNDRGIQTLVRGTGAVFMLVEEFLRKPHPPATRKESAPDPAVAEDITDELKKEVALTAGVRSCNTTFHTNQVDMSYCKT